MTRTTWPDLPAGVREAIERETDAVTAAESPSAGRNSDFSATLHTATGPVFCKGIADAGGSRGRMHRHEADINPWLPPAVAPRLRWRVETDGWLILGFDHVPGHHADLSPGSPDLAAVAAAVNQVVDDLAHCPGPAPRLAEQWARLAAWRRLAEDAHAPLTGWATEHLDELIGWEARAIEHADGDSLLHTDLHSLNILVNAGDAQVIDWAWSRHGSPAVDIAFLVARLVAAGHEPAHAEVWADALPAWRDTAPEIRTALAVAVWGIWTYTGDKNPRPLWNKLTPAAQAWAGYRLDAP